MYEVYVSYRVERLEQDVWEHLVTRTNWEEAENYMNSEFRQDQNHSYRIVSVKTEEKVRLTSESKV